MMSEILSNGRAAQMLHNEDLWQTLLREEQATNEVRNASKALRSFA